MFITIHTTLQIVKCFHQENEPFNQSSRTWFQPFSPPPSTPIHFLDLILEEMRQPRTVCIFLSLQTMLCCYIPSRSAALKTCLQRPKNRVAKALLPPLRNPLDGKGSELKQDEAFTTQSESGLHEVEKAKPCLSE